MSGWQIVEDDATGPEIRDLIAHHLATVDAGTDAEFRFALGLKALRAADITLWSLWEGQALLGCGALRDLGAGAGEVKSMRTQPGHLRRGVAAALLTHMIAVARARGWHRLLLETGTSAGFGPAHRLYARFGFVDCAAFGDYRESPHNRFMALDLVPDRA